MTALVKATPRRNGGIQIAGRVLRRGSDQTIVREIVDIVDMRTGLKSQWLDRAKDYKKKGFPVSIVKAAWSDFVEKGAKAAPAIEYVSDSDDEGTADLSLDDLLDEDAIS
jgi:hypothetical protein